MEFILAYLFITFIITCVYAVLVIRNNARGGDISTRAFLWEVALPAFLWPMLMPACAEWAIEAIEDSLARADEWANNGMAWVDRKVVWALDKIFFFLRKS